MSIKICIFASLVAANCSAATYYMDFAAGSDSNSGTSESAPWKHHPYMQGWSGSYTHTAGDRFIFKGGVTWDHTCWRMNISAGGTSGNSDYYGVDTSWYAGGAWTRPSWDGGYVSTAQNQIFISNAYVQIDNIEIMRLNSSSTNPGPGLLSWNPVPGMLITNCYIHGWRTTATSDGSYGGVVIGTDSPPTDSVLDNCEITNSENVGVQMSGVCVANVAIIRNGCKIHDNSSGVLYCIDFGGPTPGNPCELYNITGNGFDNTYHFNGIYLDVQATFKVTTGYIRNSYLHDCTNGSNTAYPNPHNYQSLYIYNNVIYGSQSAQQPIEVDPYDPSNGNGGNCYIYNNTVVLSSNCYLGVHVVSRPNVVSVLSIANNHIIYPTSGSLTDAVQGTNVATLTESNNLLESAATAAGQGYTLGNLYAPTSGSDPTVDTGTSEAGTFTSDILGVSRPQGAAWDIGAYELIGGGQRLPLSSQAD